MPTRTPAEVGAIIRARREFLHLTQDELPGLSSATVGKIERGTADRFKRPTLIRLAAALDWRPDALDMLIGGADPVDVEQITVTWDGPTGEGAVMVAQTVLTALLEVVPGDQMGGLLTAALAELARAADEEPGGIQ
jgi:transcriptional regulator with XRE-family HTH domain